MFTPRERDWQKNEIIVDNDSVATGYTEHSNHKHWQQAPFPGFALHQGNYFDNENPFEAGTARIIETTEHQHHQSTMVCPSKTCLMTGDVHAASKGKRNSIKHNT